MIATILARPVVNLVLLPLIGALHGYVTNWLAVWLLFHPRRPVRLPFGIWTVQGVLPRRQLELAHTVGEAVERELLSWDRLADALLTPELRAELAAGVDRAVRDRLEERLPRFLPAAVRRMAQDLIRDAALREVDPMLAELMETVRRGVSARPPLSALVEERLAALDVERLEGLARRAAGRELRAIVRLGLAMGLAIGLAQGALLEALGQ